MKRFRLFLLIFLCVSWLGLNAQTGKTKAPGKYYYEVTESDLSWGNGRGSFVVEDDAESAYKSGNFVVAAKYFQILYQLDTVKMWPIYRLAQLYNEQKDYTAALYYLERCAAKRLTSDWEDQIQIAKAEMYVQLKKYTVSHDLLQPYLNQSTKSGAYAMRIYGKLLKAQKKPAAQYLTWFQKACETGGDKTKQQVKEQEPDVYAQLFGTNDNWKPSQPKRDLTISNEPDPVPAAATKPTTRSSGVSRPNAGVNHIFVDCPTCNGGRKVFSTSCNICNNGIIRYETRTEKKQEGAYMKTYQYKVPVKCGKCLGTGKLTIDCSKCHGRGTIMVQQ